MDRIVVVVDMGSTSIKTVAFDQSHRIVRKETRIDFGLYRDRAEKQWSYIDPDVLWRAIAKSIREMVRGSVTPEKVDAVCVTGFGAEGLPVDTGGGSLFPIIFFDRRTDKIVDDLVRTHGHEYFFRITGKQVLPIDTVVRMLWVKKNFPGILRKTATWLTAVDYVNYRLCGRRATDRSMASCTGVFDVTKGAWSEELLKLHRIPRSIMPEVLPSGHPLGKIGTAASRATHLLEGTPVVLGGHDFHCANIAAGGGREGCVVDILGTWECLVGRRDTLDLRVGLGKLGVAVERTVEQGYFTVMNSNVAGDIMDWFAGVVFSREGVPKPGDWRELAEGAARLQGGTSGVFFLPHLFGSNSPEVDPFSLGAFVGIGRRIDIHSLYRAVVEGLNYQFREMLESLETALGKKDHRIVIVGGGAKNALWMQNKADVTGRAIETPDIPEATALGAAMIAETGLKRYRSLHHAYRDMSHERRLYKPEREKTKRYDGLFRYYREIYPALKELNKTISTKVLKG
jgi:xylulokinase